jgi:hypothetical protein
MVVDTDPGGRRTEADRISHLCSLLSRSTAPMSRYDSRPVIDYRKNRAISLHGDTGSRSNVSTRTSTC